MAVVRRVGGLAGPGDEVGGGVARLEAGGERTQGGHQQHRGPGGDEPGRKVRVGRLERVVPVAVAVGGQRGAGDAHLGDPVERPAQVVLHRGGGGEPVVAHEGQPLGEQRGVAGRLQVVTDREQGPVEDVAVGVLLAALGERREEVEGLRPVTPGVLGPEEAEQDVALVGVATQRGEQPDRPLADVAGAPGAAGELLQAAG